MSESGLTPAPVVSAASSAAAAAAAAAARAAAAAAGSRGSGGPGALFRAPPLARKQAPAGSAPAASVAAAGAPVAAASASATRPSSAVTLSAAAPTAPPPSLQLHTLPAYTDGEFSAQARDWSASIATAARTPVVAASAHGDPSVAGARNAEGFSPRSAALLDRSYMLPERLAKRQARSYQSRSAALAAYQTKEFREIFSGAALGQTVAKERALQRAAEAVPQDSAGAAGAVLLRPHLQQEKRASELAQRDSTVHASPLHHSRSESALQPASFFQRPPSAANSSASAHEAVTPTLVSRRMRAHPKSAATLRALARQPLSPARAASGGVESPASVAARAAARFAASESERGEEEDALAAIVPPPGLSNGLIFADMTGIKPAKRQLNQSALRSSASEASLSHATSVGGSAASNKPPRRLAPVSALQAEEDRLDPLAQSRSHARNRSKGAGGTAATEAGQTEADDGEDSVSDIEVNYDDLLDTDDSEDGLEDLGGGGSSTLKVRRKPTEAEARAKARRKMHNPAQLSATMLVLSGVPLPEWPHTVESEEDVDVEEEFITVAAAAAADGEQGEAPHHRRTAPKVPKPNPYAIAAAREEKALHFLDRNPLAASAAPALPAAAPTQALAQIAERPDREGGADADEDEDADAAEAESDADADIDADGPTPHELASIAKRGAALPPVAEERPQQRADQDQAKAKEHKEQESFEDGKRVLLTADARRSALDMSLRQALGGGPLDRLAVVAAENLLKRLAKEALRRGGEYLRLDESQILARLEEERHGAEERIRRAAGARRSAMPSVMPRQSSLATLHDPLATRSLADMTPMQQKNMSEREEMQIRLGEQARAALGDGTGDGKLDLGLLAVEDADRDWKSFLQPGGERLYGTREGAALRRARRPQSGSATSGPARPRAPTMPIVDARGHVAPEFKRLAPSRSMGALDAGAAASSDGQAAAAAEALSLPLAQRPAFTTHIGSSVGFPPAKPLPSGVVAAHLRPPRALGTQVERWLRQHGQIVKRKLDPASLAKYRAIFALLDEDSSGTLSLGELQSALRDIGVGMTLSELGTMARDIKAESLRSQSQRRRNLIDFDEFVNGLARAGEWDTLCRLAEQRKKQSAERRKAKSKSDARAASASRQRLGSAAESAHGQVPQRHASSSDGSSSFILVEDEHGNPFRPDSATMRRSSPSPPSTPMTDAEALNSIDPRLLASAGGAAASGSGGAAAPTASPVRTSRSSVMFGSAPVIGGAGLGIDPLTGMSAPLPLFHTRDLQDTTPAHSNGPSRRPTQGAAALAGSGLPLRTDDSDEESETNRTGEGRSTRRTAASSTGTGRVGHGGAAAPAEPSNTANLLPFTLWVPAYNRWKKLDKMMSIETLSDAQLQALLEEEQLALAQAAMASTTKGRHADPATAMLTQGAPPSPSHKVHRALLSLNGADSPDRRTGSMSPQRRRAPLPVLASSGTFITPEEVWGTHQPSWVESEVTRTAPDGTSRTVKVVKKVMVPLENPAATSAAVAAAVSAAGSADRPASAALLGPGGIVVAKTRRPLGQMERDDDASDADHEGEEEKVQPKFEAVEMSPPVAAAQAPVSASADSSPPLSPSASAAVTPRPPPLEVPFSPSAAPLTSPVRGGAPLSSPHYRSLVSESQERLDARGNVLDPLDLAGRDLLHPNPHKPYRTAEDEKALARLGKGGAATGGPQGSNGASSKDGAADHDLSNPTSPTHAFAAFSTAAAAVGGKQSSRGSGSARRSSFVLDPLASESSQSLPFLWRQTQENVRVSRLQSEAARAAAEYESIRAGEEEARRYKLKGSAFSAGGLLAPSGPKSSPEALALERARKHAQAAATHQALIRETESKRITREIFENFNKKAKENKERQRDAGRAAAAQAMAINKELRTQGQGAGRAGLSSPVPAHAPAASSKGRASSAGTGRRASTSGGAAQIDSFDFVSGASSRDALLATRFQPPAALHFQSSSDAAAMFAAAASGSGASDAGVSTRMLAAAQHLRKEAATHARLAAAAAAKKQAKKEQALRDMAAEAAAARAAARRAAREEAARAAAGNKTGVGSGSQRSAQGSERPRTTASLAASSSRTVAPSPTPSASPGSSELTAAEAAALAVAALAEEDPSLTMDDFIPLPSLDFLGGARLRAQTLLEAERRAAVQRSLMSLDHFGELVQDDSAAGALPPGGAAAFLGSALDSLPDPVSTAATLGADPRSLVASHRAVELDIGRSLGRLEAELARDEAEQQEEEARANGVSASVGSSSTSDPASVSSLPPTDYTSITALWGAAARNIEESRSLLREKQRADAVRARRDQKASYAEQAARAYGSHITQQNTANAGDSGRALAESDRAEDAALEDQLLGGVGDNADARRQAELEWLLFSSTAPAPPDVRPKRTSMIDNQALRQAAKNIQEKK